MRTPAVAKPVKRRRRRAAPATPPPAPVTASQVHPLVWETARELAGGQSKRLEILSETAVRVLNHAPGKPSHAR